MPSSAIGHPDARHDDLDLESQDDRALYRQRVDHECRNMRLDALQEQARADASPSSRRLRRRDCIRLIAEARIRQVTGTTFR